ncbi:uncharacterized protein LOC110427565 [Herrania umbratica]|uniref:Uncharacterized protein LOC110427565 n=1 Tax=Herrania umbratica TaxID=108875 RepID=A0A6J1BKK0_9ROSI|nr:uncharacterized protein LOC110427565 [Herrania umbratica]
MGGTTDSRYKGVLRYNSFFCERQEKRKETHGPRKEREPRVSKHKKHACSKRRFEPDQKKGFMKKQKTLESKLADLKKEMNHEELQEYQEKLGQLEQNFGTDISREMEAGAVGK